MVLLRVTAPKLTNVEKAEEEAEVGKMEKSIQQRHKHNKSECICALKFSKVPMTSS